VCNAPIADIWAAVGMKRKVGNFESMKLECALEDSIIKVSIAFTRIRRDPILQKMFEKLSI
jgi:hypothetical protein